VAAVGGALSWGVVRPAAMLLGAVLLGRVALLALLVYPAQIARLARQRGGGRFAWEQGLFLTLGKCAEATGILSYHWRRLRGGPVALIEYK